MNRAGGARDAGRVRQWTVIVTCLAVVLSGAVAYAVTRGSDPAPAPAPTPARATAEPQITFPAHIRALPPEVRARLYAQAAEKAKAERKNAGKSFETERRSSRRHAVEQAEPDPGIGGPSGGTPAPGGGSSPRPIVAPTPVPTVVPSTTPTPSVSVPAGTTVGTAIDLITAATGAAPKTTLPPSASLVPESTVIDCAASAPGAKSADDRSGSNKDDLVRAVVDALCTGATTPPADTKNHSGPGNGSPDDRSGPAGASGSSQPR